MGVALTERKEEYISWLGGRRVSYTEHALVG